LITERSRQELLNAEAGVFGVEVIADTAFHDGPFCMVVALADSLIESCESEGGRFENRPLAAKQTLRAPQITGLKLTSGRVLAARSTGAIPTDSGATYLAFADGTFIAFADGTFIQTN
jgi:hypothetical protein